MENNNRKKEIHQELKTLLDGVVMSINHHQKVEMFRLYNELYSDKQNNVNCSACVRLVFSRCKYFIETFIDNTFDEKVVTINVDDEIQSGNDFILYVSNSATFNSSDQVNSNTDFIAIATADVIYPANTYVRYYTNNGNTAVSGLSNNAFYFVATSNSSGVTLSSTAGGANVNITQASNVATFNSNTSVDGTANFISITNANTVSGQKLYKNAAVFSVTKSFE
jgi:hypothetical protein